MSESGTRPEPPGEPTTNAAAGWYPDPGGSGQLRYWDGDRWTTHVEPPQPGLTPSAEATAAWGTAPNQLDPFAAQPAQAYQSYPAYQAYPAYRPQTNGMAIASLVVSLAGFVSYGIGFILGIVFGHIALSQLSRAAGAQEGRGLALAGLIVGYIGVAVGFLVFLALLFYLPAAGY